MSKTGKGPRKVRVVRHGANAPGGSRRGAASPPARMAAKPRATKASKATSASAKSAAGAKSAPRRRKTAPRKRRGGGRGRGGGGPIAAILALPRLLLRLLWGFGWHVGAVVAVIIAVAVGVVASGLPPAAELVDGRTRGSVTLLDRSGEVFAWRGDQFGGVITADTVSPHLKAAILSTEDRRFYRHFGVSPRGVASAIRINLSEGRGALEGHGGSTITQQTAKLLCLGQPYDPAAWESEAAYEADCRRSSLTRKAREAIYAMAMEVAYSKDEILTIYMNRAYLGAGARGFQAAAQRYFGTSAADLNPAEAAMLAGLLVAPARFAPTNDLDRAQGRAAVIVGLMEEEGYLSPTEAAVALANPATLSAAAEARAGGYFADWIMETAPSFLASRTTEDVIVETTFDVRLQRAAEAAVAEVFAEKVREGSKAQAAVVVMSAEGAVRAMVGGRATRVSGQFNRATQALRQTGSAFKPFVYATALELGYTPLARVEDAPLTLRVPGSGNWSPQNYSRDFKGKVTLTEALAQSLNIPAVKVSEAVGRDLVRRVAADFGIDSPLDAGPALALGTSEATLLEMTAAYAGILNGGRSVMPYGMRELRLLKEDTALMGQGGGMGERVISEGAARSLVWMMHQVVEAGTGARAKLADRPVAGKTGTTSAARDAWFIGFTGNYVAGVWMGYDDNSPLSGVTGGGLPAEIWHETMVGVHDGLAPVALPMDVPDRAPAAPLPTDPPRTAQAAPAPGGAPSAPARTVQQPNPVREAWGSIRDFFRGN